MVSEQIKARAGETLLETAISLQKTGLHTPAQQAIHLALPVVESKNLALQRKFSLGYNRAARIIDQMEENGIVSSMGANGKREILV